MSDSSQKAVMLRPHVSIGDGMTYKRAWVLIDTLNRGFSEPVVETSSGGRGGGGAHLTPLGEQLVACYTALETKAGSAVQAELATLAKLAG